jgi:hypothetical protein
MSGLACGLIVIGPLARSRLLGGLIQLVLAELERMANCHVDLADELFRYLNRNLDHQILPLRYLELSKIRDNCNRARMSRHWGTVLLGLHYAELIGLA